MTTYTVIATIRCTTKAQAEYAQALMESKGATVKIVERRDLQSKPVVSLDDGTIYPSAAEACRLLDIDAGNMSKHLRGRLKQIHGKRFAYA